MSGSTASGTSPLIATITSDDDGVRNRSLDSLIADASLSDLLDQTEQLDRFWRGTDNLYHRVRALLFLAAIHRYQMPTRLAADRSSEGPVPRGGGALIPHEGYEHLLGRRFVEAVDHFRNAMRESGPSDPLCSALAAAYHELAFQTLADQVRASVRTVRGNRWMFRLGHPLDHPLRIRPELTAGAAGGEPGDVAPILTERTAVRMDFSHSAWSDIFFLGMDFPEGARVLNVSIDLAVRGRDAAPRPPIETFVRVIDRPVIRLTSVDLGVSTDVTTVAEVFDFARDYLGLLKAALIAAGIVPPGLEGYRGDIAELLDRIIGGGRGLELVSQINDIPKGSRLAVSTNLLGSLIAVLMRATGQVRTLEGPLVEADRRIVAARAILGEWLGGSGGGWQDSGGVWPGIKLIGGAAAEPGDPEYGISRGRLLPWHQVFDDAQISQVTRDDLQRSLVLVHGGMAQNVGPILQMVTEHYLLRSDGPWAARQEALRYVDEIIDALRAGDIRRIGEITTRNFEGPLQSIIPWATNRFTDLLIQHCRERWGDDFWGFWMLGGMSGGGMGFIFDPAVKPAAQDWLGTTMRQVKADLQTGLPFAMDPVVYEFSINDRGTTAELLTGDAALMPDRYHAMWLPRWLRRESRDLSPQTRAEVARVAEHCRRGGTSSAAASLLIDSVLPLGDEGGSDRGALSKALLAAGFDRQQHEQIREEIREGRFGLAQNRLSGNTTISDVSPEDVHDFSRGTAAEHRRLGEAAIREGRVAVVTLAAGVGSRWTEGAGVCKALHPFHRFAGRHRNFLEVHLAKNRAATERHGGVLSHLVTTSHLTDGAIRQALEREDGYGFEGPLIVSTGRSVGLRMVPMVRDLKFLFEETPQQVLDEQQQKLRESGRAALIRWARDVGEASDYTDNVPAQCMHPVGHWYEVPNLLLSGALAELIRRQPKLTTLMLHNIDTLGADVDAGMLGAHLAIGATLSFEVIRRRLEDRGGGLARVDGRVRLIEGLAIPDERIESSLTFYNSMTTWIDVDGLLAAMGLRRDQLHDATLVSAAIRTMAGRLPTYITLKDVKKRWGHGQEDVFPVSQFEKLWSDMTTLPELRCNFFEVPLRRGQQLKTQAQLDPWKRDGSAAFVDSLCRW